MTTNRVITLLAGMSAWACGGNTTQPPGPPSNLVTSGGDGQNWYFDNPLPTPLSVTALDVDGRAVPGVVVTWSVASGGGAVSPLQSTTNASGIATTTDSIGSPATSTRQTVNATFTGSLGPATFSEFATSPPTAASVSVADFSFSPQAVVIQTGGTVTWTWGGAAPHNVTYDGGPTPLPASSGNKLTGTFPSTITTVGRYTYHCTIHPTQMTGSVTVVH
jgi:plastocyanin